MPASQQRLWAALQAARQGRGEALAVSDTA